MKNRPKVSTHTIKTNRHVNGTWTAKMAYNGSHYGSQDGCDTEREAIASLVLAMGLLDEIKLLESVSPDADLYG